MRNSIFPQKTDEIQDFQQKIKKYQKRIQFNIFTEKISNFSPKETYQQINISSAMGVAQIAWSRF